MLPKTAEKKPAAEESPADAPAEGDAAEAKEPEAAASPPPPVEEPAPEPGADERGSREAGWLGGEELKRECKISCDLFNCNMRARVGER